MDGGIVIDQTRGLMHNDHLNGQEKANSGYKVNDYASDNEKIYFEKSDDFDDLKDYISDHVDYDRREEL